MRGILDNDILNNKRRLAKAELDRLHAPDDGKLYVPEEIPHLQVVNSDPSLMSDDKAKEHRQNTVDDEKPFARPGTTTGMQPIEKG